MKDSSDRMSFILWTVVGVLAVLIMGMIIFRRAPKAVEPPREKPIPVRVLMVEPRHMEDLIELSGRLEPIRQASLAAEKPGRVVSVKADKGDAVASGQLLMQIDDRSWQSSMKAAEIEKADAGNDRVRWEAMKKTGSVPDADYEKVLKRADMAAVGLEQAEIAVSQCKVKSPFAGTVDDRFVDEGEYAHEGATMLRVVDVSRLKVAFDVPEQEILSVARGLQVEFVVSAAPSQVHTGEVVFVAAEAGRENNSYRTELVAENPGQHLKAGMITRVRLVRRSRENAIVLPLAAVVPHKGDKIVFVVKDGRAARRLIRIESIAARDVVVSEGIEPGEMVVIEGQRTLQDGVPVEIRDDSATQAASGDGKKQS